MANLLMNITDEIKKSLVTFNVFDDFTFLDTANYATVEGDAGASVANDADGINGLIDFVTTSANEEAYLYTKENYQFILDKPMMAIARFQWANAGADKFQFAFGFADGIATDWILDGGGMDLTFDGALIYKKIDESNFRFLTSDGVTKIDTVLDVTSGSASYMSVAIGIEPNGAGVFDAYPLFDTAGGNALVGVAENGASARAPLVKHNATFTTPTEMALAIGMKQGSAAAESMKLDLWGVSKLR